MYKKIICILLSLIFILSFTYTFANAYTYEHYYEDFKTSRCSDYVIDRHIQSLLTDYSSWIIIQGDRNSYPIWYEDSVDDSHIHQQCFYTQYVFVLCGRVVFYDIENASSTQNYGYIYANECYVFAYNNDSVFTLVNYFSDDISNGTLFYRFSFSIPYTQILAFNNFTINHTRYAYPSSDGVTVSSSDTDYSVIDSDSYISTETDTDKEYKNGVIGWFQRLFDNISGGFSNIGNSISSFVSSVGGWFGDLGTNISNWFSSVGDWFSATWDKITAIPGQIIDGLKTLFIPTVNPFGNLLETFKAKFPIIDQIYDLLQVFTSTATYNNVPSFDLNIYGVEYTFGFDWYLNYRPLIQGIIVGIIYITYAIRLFKRLPSIIGGFSDSNNTSTTIQQ